MCGESFLSTTKIRGMPSFRTITEHAIMCCKSYYEIFMKQRPVVESAF